MSLLRSLCRAVPRSPRCVPLCTKRTLSTRTSPPNGLFSRLASSRGSRIGLASGTLVATGLWLAAQSPVHADAEKEQVERHSVPLSALVRAYVVYAMCSIPALVDYSPAILNTMLSIPGVKQLTEAFVRVTFFDQVSLISNFFLKHINPTSVSSSALIRQSPRYPFWRL